MHSNFRIIMKIVWLILIFYSTIAIIKAAECSSGKNKFYKLDLTGSKTKFFQSFFHKNFFGFFGSKSIFNKK